MLKDFYLKLKLVAVAVIVMAGGLTANAERLVTENFDYALGALYGQENAWLQYGTQVGGTLDVVDNALTFAGYQANAVGKAVKIGNMASGQDVMIKFAEAPVTTGSVFFSALINVQSVTADNVYFMSFVAPGSAGVVDKKTASEIGRLYAIAGSEGKFKLKISRNSATQQSETTEEYDLNKTYLVVMEYQFVDGKKNDIVRLWVNPADKAKAPAPVAIVEDPAQHTSADASRLQAIEFRQGSSSSFTGPEVIVDALHIAYAWGDLFDSQAAKTDPEMNVTPTVVYKGEPLAIGTTATFAKFTVDYKNLTAPINVYLTGTDRDSYTIDVEKINAGSGKAVVTLTYAPKAIGKHNARINFETSVNTLNVGFAATGWAYDPENLPTITVNGDGLKKFECKAGETASQSFTVTTANFPDYGKVAVKGESKGAFVINNASLLKNGETKITVTFKPLTAGSYTETIEFTGMKAEPKSIVITGVAAPGAPEPGQEGDLLPLSTDNPMLTLNEDFSGTVKNKPFEAAGWKNVALKGQRAWWGYEWTGADANKAVKVTGYDSKIEAGMGTDCQMMLFTPALDFKNATNKVFSFRVMGDFMVDGHTDKLEVCYVEKEGESFYAEPIKIDIPATKDLNKEWKSFDVHLEEQKLADVFFIGFRFTGMRGSDNSTVYYIDDVKWNVTPTAVTGVENRKSIVGTQYVNVAGSVSDAPFEGVNIVKTVYSDGSVKTQKMIRK